MRTEDMMKNSSAFIPAWMGKWEPDPHMLDFEEKWMAFHTPGGRLMSCAHRGDNNIIYPENSLEGFLSVMMAGADIVEADIRTTRDGELVIMHDDTLTRTTNVTAMREKRAFDMPDDDMVANWSLEEIRRLRLVTKQGEVTEYAVPTLRELISLAKDRAFITLDKVHAFSWEDGVYPLLKEQNAFRTVLIPYNYDLERVLEMQNHMREKVGCASPYYACAVRKGGITDIEKIGRAVPFLAEHGMLCALRCGEYVPEEGETMDPVIAPLKGNYRIYAETLRRVHDDSAHWKQMVESGYNIIMGNQIYEFLRFEKETVF